MRREERILWTGMLVGAVSFLEGVRANAPRETREPLERISGELQVMVEQQMKKVEASVHDGETE